LRSVLSPRIVHQENSQINGVLSHKGACLAKNDRSYVTVH